MPIPPTQVGIPDRSNLKVTSKSNKPYDFETKIVKSFVVNEKGQRFVQFK